MYDLDIAIPIWLRWKNQIDWSEAKRATGNKSSSLEYRFMREAGTAPVDGPRVFVHEQLVLDLDHAIKNVAREFPGQMEAVEIYYKRKNSFRAVRIELGISSHSARKMVFQGQDMIKGALCIP